MEREGEWEPEAEIRLLLGEQVALQQWVVATGAVVGIAHVAGEKRQTRTRASARTDAGEEIVDGLGVEDAAAADPQNYGDGDRAERLDRRELGGLVNVRHHLHVARAQVAAHVLHDHADAVRVLVQRRGRRRGGRDGRRHRGRGDAQALLAGAVQAQAPKPMKLTLNLLAGGPQAGFMYAKVLGLYDKAGIDLTIEEGRGSGTPRRSSPCWPAPIRPGGWPSPRTSPT